MTLILSLIPYFFSILKVGVGGTLWHDGADMNTNMDNYLVVMMITVVGINLLKSFSRRRTTENVCGNTDRQLCLRSWQWTALKLPNNQHRSLLVSASLKNIIFTCGGVCVCVLRQQCECNCVFPGMLCWGHLWFSGLIWLRKAWRWARGSSLKDLWDPDRKSGFDSWSCVCVRALTCADGCVCTCADVNSHKLRRRLCVCVP